MDETKKKKKNQSNTETLAALLITLQSSASGGTRSAARVRLYLPRLPLAGRATSVSGRRHPPSYGQKAAGGGGNVSLQQRQQLPMANSRASHQKGISFDMGVSGSGSKSTAGRALTCANKHGEWPA